MELNEEQIERYSRQIMLPQVGGQGQQKIMASKVLLVGTGGLGSPISLYLAAAGVGKIGLIDSDAVETNNLQRQIVHSTKTVGVPKVDSAANRLKELNPNVEVVPHNVWLTAENIMDIIKDYDIVADGSDNFPTRYLINDACVMAKKPLSHGAIFQFDGQLMTIIPGETPCYRCLFPEPPPPGLVPSCQEAGILGAVAGVVGVLQANEIIKYLLGIGNILRGKLLTFNALESSFRQIKVPKDRACPICGENPTIKELIDYEIFCGITKSQKSKHESQNG